jgi:aerobic-type carbon monoxide dehydrogenase small subunit (CoxS/CutS family)
MVQPGLVAHGTVIMDGQAGNILYAFSLRVLFGTKIETVEGLAAAKHPIIEAYKNINCMQCLLHSGFIMTA